AFPGLDHLVLELDRSGALLVVLLVIEAAFGGEILALEAVNQLVFVAGGLTGESRNDAGQEKTGEVPASDNALGRHQLALRRFMRYLSRCRRMSCSASVSSRALLAGT